MLLFKTCIDCREFLPNNRFYSYKQQNKGVTATYYKPRCKACESANSKAIRAQSVNPDKYGRVYLYQGEE